MSAIGVISPGTALRKNIEGMLQDFGTMGGGGAGRIFSKYLGVLKLAQILELGVLKSHLAVLKLWMLAKEA